MFEPDWAPSVSDVAVLIPARTKDSLGNNNGAFSALTRPTFDQVGDQIETAVAEVSNEIGIVPDLVQDNARRVTAIYAASLVELSYFQDQVNTGRSTYAQLVALYEKALARLKIQVAEIVDGGTENNAALLPVFSFPPIDCGMVGLWNRW